LCVLAIAFLGTFHSSAWANERYFVVVFSSQAKPKLPRFTHVWATMIKVCNAEQPPAQWTYQIETISWFPASLSVHIFRLRPEAGANLGLQETLCVVQKQGQHISAWGPFEVPQSIYCEFMAQKARLESGQVRYKAIDRFRNPADVSDCIHSLSDMDQARRRADYPLSRVGDDAARDFAAILTKRGCCAVKDGGAELAYQALGLQCGCITRR
jgi:hypothetical protein